MTAYIGLLRKDKNSDYGLDFPDFPGCVTAGRTLDEARRMAAKALACHIEWMQADGQDIPAPSSLETIMANGRNKAAVAVLLDVPEKPERALRINVALPEDLVQSIDQVATNRSRFLAAAARDRLRRQRKSA
jgi:predicted RNase H-like HicB family nuclease